MLHGAGYSISVVLLLFLVLLCFLFVAAPVSAALHTCDATNGGHLQLTSLPLGAATFSVVEGCTAITINSCSADSITFPALTSIAISINGLACSVATAPPGTCVSVSTVSGGSIDINGMSRTITGSAAGNYLLVHFGGAVASVSGINIKSVSLATSVSAAGATLLSVIYFSTSLSGNSAPGSILNVSGNTITAESSMRSTSQYCAFYLLNIESGGLAGGFSTWEMSNNSMQNLRISGETEAVVNLARVMSRIELTGTNTRIIFKNNNFRGVAVSGGQGLAQLVSTLISPYDGVNVISGVSEIVMHEIDVRDIVMTSSSACRLRVIFILCQTFTMTHAGKIDIRDVHVSGSAAVTSSQSDYHEGIKMFDLQSTTISGINDITVSDCSIDMSAGGGYAVSGNVIATTSVVDILRAISSLLMVSIRNATIRGKYSSSASSRVDLFIFRAQNSFSGSTATTVSVTIIDSGIFTAANVFFDNGPVAFVAAVSNTIIDIRRLACGSVTRTTSTSACIAFSSTVTGGSISIDGLTRTISSAGSAVVGDASMEHCVARFNNGAVSGVKSISIKNIRLTTQVDSDGPWTLYVVYFSEVTGDSSAGCVFNFSGNSIVRGSRWVSRTAHTFVRFLVANNRIAGFQSLIISDNSVAGFTVSAITNCDFVVVLVHNQIELTGDVNSHIVLNNNSLRGVSISSSTRYALLVLFHFPYANVNAVSGVSALLVDGADLRDVVAQAGTWGAVRAIVIPSAVFTMTQDGTISITHARISGTASWSATDNAEGVKVFELRSTNNISSVKSMTVADCSIDMATGSGFAVTGASATAEPAIVDLHPATSNIDTLTVTRCYIRGKYSSAGSSVSLVIFRARNTISDVRTLRMMDNVIEATSANASATHGFALVALAQFAAAIRSVSSLVVSGCHVRGVYSALAGNTALRIVDFSSSASTSLSSAQDVSIIDNTINAAASSSGAVATSVTIAYIAGALSISASIYFARNAVQGTYSSSSLAPVCRSQLWIEPGASLTLTSGTVNNENFAANVQMDGGTAAAGSFSAASLDVLCGPATTSTLASSSGSPLTSTIFSGDAANSSTLTTALINTTATATAASSTTTSTSSAPTTTTRRPRANQTRSHTMSILPKLELEPKQQVVSAASRATTVAFSMLSPPAAATSLRALSAVSSMIGCGAVADAKDEIDSATKARAEAEAADSNVNSSSSGNINRNSSGGSNNSDNASSSSSSSNNKTTATYATAEETGSVLQPLGWDNNILLLSIGQGELSTYRGAVISAVVLTVAVLGAGYFLAFVRSVSRSISFDDGCMKTHVPGVLAFSNAVVMSPCMYAATVLLLHPQGDRTFAIVGIVWALLPFLLYIYLARHFAKNEALLPEPKDSDDDDGGDDDDGDDEKSSNKQQSPSAGAGKKNDKKNDKTKSHTKSQQQSDDTTNRRRRKKEVGGIFETLVTLIEFFCDPVRAYPKDSYSAQCWSFFVENWRLPYYGAFDLGVAVLLSAAAGVADGFCRTRTCCLVMSIVSTAASFTYLVSFLLLRPALVPFDRFMMPTMSAFVSLLGLFAILASAKVGGDSFVTGMEVVTEVMYHVAVFGLVVETVANVLPSVLWLANTVRQKCCPAALSPGRQESYLAQLVSRHEQHDVKRQGKDPVAYPTKEKRQEQKNQQRRDADGLDVPIISAGTRAASRRPNLASLSGDEEEKEEMNVRSQQHALSPSSSRPPSAEAAAAKALRQRNDTRPKVTAELLGVRNIVPLQMRMAARRPGEKYGQRVSAADVVDILGASAAHAVALAEARDAAGRKEWQRQEQLRLEQQLEALRKRQAAEAEAEAERKALARAKTVSSPRELSDDVWGKLVTPSTRSKKQ